MSAKPICVIRIPDSHLGGSLDQDKRYLLQEWFEKNRTDYYWFILPNYDGREIEFQVFFEKDHQPISYEELKELIVESLKPPTSEA